MEREGEREREEEREREIEVEGKRGEEGGTRRMEKMRGRGEG